MKMKKLLALLLAIAVLFCLTGCGTTKQEPEATEATESTGTSDTETKQTEATETEATETEATETAAERTVITLTSPYRDLSTFEAAFEAAYPQYDLQNEHLASGVINGEITRRLRNHHGSDLVVTNLPSGEVSNYALDLSTEEMIEKYQAQITKTITIDGQSRYLPLPSCIYGYIINKTLLDELGLDLPETQADILNILSTAREKGVGVNADGYCFGIGTIGGTYLGALIVSNFATDYLSSADGARWLDDFSNGNATFAGTWESSVDFLKTLVDSGYLNAQKVLLQYNQSMSSTANAFKTEVELPERTAIMAFDDLYYYKCVCESSEDEFVMLPLLPATSDGQALVSAVSSNYIFINKDIAEDPEHLEGAKCVLNFLSTEEGQKLWIDDTQNPYSFLNDFPVDESIVPESMYTYIEHGMIFSNPFPADVLTVIGTQLVSVITKGADISEALAAIDDYCANGSEDTLQEMDVIGTVEVDMICENNNVRYEETQLGNLISDAIREMTGADVALVNGGGIRSSLYAGDVTGSDLSAVCPYANLIIVSEMDGATLRAAITNGIQKTWKPAGQFLQVSGVCYSYRAAADENGTAELVSLTHADGTPVEDDEVLKVAYTNYMGGSGGYVDSGDGFTMLNVYDSETPIAVTLLEETGMTYKDALTQYFANHADEKISAPLEGRITIVE